MDCNSVMAPIKVSLYTDELARDVIAFMVEKHMGLVPVTERDGTFAGLVSGDSLIKFLLPKSLTAIAGGGGLMHRGFHVHKNASYLNESACEMQERLNVQTAKLDTPLIDALMMIKDKQFVVPVVDDDNKLLGAISFFSVLYGLNEEYDRENAELQKMAERAERMREKDQKS